MTVADTARNADDPFAHLLGRRLGAATVDRDEHVLDDVVDRRLGHGAAHQPRHEAVVVAVDRFEVEVFVFVR